MPNHLAEEVSVPEQESSRFDCARSELDFDYSTPEAEAALRRIAPLVLEIRDELATPADRRLQLYERTLGLAVIPVLLRRALVVLIRRLKDERT